MEAKQKAEELYSKYDSLLKVPFKKHLLIKQCALMAVDEILEIELLVESVDDYYLRYWQEVKQEIETSINH